VRGASDAGIYVGQSSNIIVRNSIVEYNVAGIEIENSSGADVYGNIARNNTGGVLVFDLPDLPVSGGNSTRIFANQILANNTRNFAPPAISSPACRPAPASSSWRTGTCTSLTIRSRTTSPPTC
jgi:parallel beta-helix repeat protein